MPQLDTGRFIVDRVSILIMLLVAAAVWVTWPVVELGADDDWSYARTAFDLARTGHIHYNGWATIMLGALAYWGAAAAKLFGPSFTVLRLSMLPFTMAVVAMLMRIGRRSNLGTSWTILLTLTVALSPAFIFCATNFSSDVPGFLCILLCADLAATIICTLDRRIWRKVALVMLLGVIGFIGGTTRQIVWGMPMVCLLSVAWHGRRERPVVVASLLSLGVMVLGIIACERWYRAQPYAIAEYFGPSVRAWSSALPGSLVPLLSLMLAVACLLLPITAAAMPMLRPNRPWKMVVILATAILPVVLLGLRCVGPWLGNTITANGINSELDAIGANPEILPMWLCLLLTGITLASVGAYACAAIAGMHKSRESRRTYAHHVRVVLTVYAVGYVGLILIRSATGGMFDRYAIPLLFIAGLWIAHFANRYVQRVSWTAWALLGAFACFSVANTHDYFAAARARLAAATALEARGIPRTQITAGMAYDAWTQLDHSGYINDGRIANPPGAFHPHPRLAAPSQVDFWYWEWTPDVTPRYFVMNAPRADLLPASVGPIAYAAWLPPFARAVYVGKKPG